MATQIAERRENPVTVIRQNLQAMAPEFQAALPKHISVEKFTRTAMTAIQSNPDLQEAERRSLFGAIVKLAQDGLLPDGREAAIVIFNTKNRGGGWDKKAQAMPMIAGILKKIRNSGDVAKVSAHVVCENDEFVWHLGFDEDVTHNPPPLDQPRGRIIGTYATAVLKDGERLLEVMSLEEIERVRAVSRSKDKGPWVDWFGEMARKTVMRRLSKRLPMSTDLDDPFERDDTLNHVDTPVISMAAPEPVSRLDALEQHIQAEHDPDTGEVIEEGGDQSNTGEGPDLANAIADIEAAEIIADVNARLAEYEGQFSGDALDELRNAAAVRVHELSGK
jgi:recombination protein RecT